MSVLHRLPHLWVSERDRELAARDELLYGTSFARLGENGQLYRVDPGDIGVRIMSDDGLAA